MSSQSPSDADAATAADTQPRARRAARLLCLAAAILYLELAVIRFASAQVLYLGYFSNFVLISVFVGLGLGFLAARRAVELRAVIPFALLFLFALLLVAEFDADTLRNRGGLFFFGNRTASAGLPGPALLVLLFLATVALFAGLAQQTGRLFNELRPLQAYTLDIAGSLLGIVLFSAQSYAWSAPPVWMATATALLVLASLLGGRAREAVGDAAAGLAVAVLLLAARPGGEIVWSAYQKLALGPELQQRVRALYANGILHQFIQPASAAAGLFYQVPFDLQRRTGQPLDRVLVVGAGNGSDVALALRNGARRVDAVEIDGAIVELGRVYHPDKPFASPRVTTHVADGRELLRRPGPSYDLILFALPDSLVLLSSMSSLRLESYLFTLEAFREARARLKPGGMLALYNQYRWDWLAAKIRTMLLQVFGRPPVEVHWHTTTVFAIGERLWGPSRAEDAAPPPAARDDWPFLYMQRPGIPWPYVAVIGMFAIASLLGVWLLAPAGTLRRPDWPFFLMGVAFLLLETKSIAQFSLLFGTTWIVNSLVFGGILTSVLCANLLAARLRLQRRWPLFVLLAATLALAGVLPPATLLAIEAPALRYAATVVLTFSPIFIANLIFSREFRDAEASARAFGWNMLGAVIGGGLEYSSLLLGHARLLWVVGGCYLVVALLLRSRGRLTGRAAGGT